MTFKDRRITTTRCRLCLPEFLAEKTDELSAVSLMNTFYEHLEKEIVSYTEEVGESIRLYTAEYEIRDEKGVFCISIRLSARKCVRGVICISRREVFCKWRGTKLIGYLTTDL